MQRKRNTGTGGTKGLAGGTKHWCGAWDPVCLMRRVRRRNRSAEALKSREQGHAALPPNLCPHLGNS